MVLRLSPVLPAPLSIGTTPCPSIMFRKPAVELRVCIAGGQLMQARRARHFLLHVHRIRHFMSA